MPRRSRGRRKLRAPRPPRAAAIALETRIRRIGDDAWQMIDDILVPVLVREQERVDDMSDAVRGSLLAIAARLRQVHTDEVIGGWAATAGRSVDATHRAQFYARLANAIGVQVVIGERRTHDVIQGWTDEGASLIRSVRDSVVGGLSREITQAFEAGVRHEELARRWRERGLPLEFGTLEGRAKVIARDQIGKLNGRLTMARQLDAGITSYTWRTLGGPRVRDTHAAREGRVYRWEKPPQGGHPGEDVQCRCSAEAFVDLDMIAGRSNVVLMPAPPPRPGLPAAALPGLAL